MDWLHNVLGYMPFILMTDNGKLHMNKTRIVESIIFAIIGGLLSSYITIQVLSWRMSEMEKKVDKIYNDIYKPYIGTQESK